MRKMKKNRRLRTVLIAAVIIVVTVCVALVQFAPGTISSGVSVFGRSLHLIAHRGLSASYPESSEDAYIAAGKAGFYGAECDVHTTKDGVLVVMHDETVDKTTDGTGAIEDMTFEEIEKLNIDTGNGLDNCTNRKVITIGQYLAVCSDYGMVPYIELKNLDTQYLPDLFTEIENYGLSDKCVLISFSFDYLIQAREIDRSMKMMLISNSLTNEDVDECIKYGFGIDFDFLKLITYSGAVNYATENGLELCAWTVDAPVVADFLHLIGCDYITTNRIYP